MNMKDMNIIAKITSIPIAANPVRKFLMKLVNNPRNCENLVIPYVQISIPQPPYLLQEVTNKKKPPDRVV